MKQITMILLVLIGFICISFTQQQDEQPVVKKKVEAVYPKAAIDAGIDSIIVLVEITVTKAGEVFTAMVKDADRDKELLNNAALDAIVKWEFYPLKKECKITIPFKFKLAK